MKSSETSKLRQFRSFWGQMEVFNKFYVKFFINIDLTGALLEVWKISIFLFKSFNISFTGSVSLWIEYSCVNWLINFVNFIKWITQFKFTKKTPRRRKWQKWRWEQIDLINSKCLARIGKIDAIYCNKSTSTIKIQILEHHMGYDINLVKELIQLPKKVTLR